MNSKRIINEYNLINEYTGINYNYSKQVYGQISKKNEKFPFFLENINAKLVLVRSVTVNPKMCQNFDFKSPKLEHLF